MAPVNLTTEAVVISASALGESDLLITLFTSHTGKLKAVAKGAKRSTKRFMNALEPFTELTACLAKSRPSGMWRLDSAVIQDGHESIRTDFNRFLYASLCLELTDLWQKEGIRDPVVLELLKWYLSEVSSSTTPLICSLIFKTRLLKTAGFMPCLTECKICGMSPTDNPVFFDRATGEVFCKRCQKGRSGGSLGLGTAMSLDFMGRAGLDKVGRIRLSKDQSLEAWQFMKQLHCRHLHKKPSSYKLISISR